MTRLKMISKEAGLSRRDIADICNEYDSKSQIFESLTILETNLSEVQCQVRRALKELSEDW